MDLSIELQEELIKALTDSKPFWESPFAVGVVAAFSAISATFVQKHQAHKLQERQSEIEKKLKVHELQLKALQELSSIKYSVTPNVEPFPGADSHEWLSPVVHSLSKITKDLDLFIKNHSFVCPESVLEHVMSSIHIANENKWGLMSNPDHEPTEKEISSVLDLISTLEKAVSSFKVSLGVNVE